MLSKSYIKQEETFVDDGLKTVLDCIKYYATGLGDREAIVFASHSGTRKAVTWIDILDKSIAMAKSMINLGVKPGEFIAVNIRSCPEWLYTAFGTMFAGASVASISFTYKDGSDLVATMEKIATCSMLVMDPGEDGQNWEIVRNLLDDYSPDGTASSKKMPYLRYILACQKGDDKFMSGVKLLDDLIRVVPQDVTLPNVTEDMLALLLQTSGSTGVPKLVEITHRNIMFVHKAISGGGDFLDQKNTQFNDRPFTWAGGFPWSVVCGQRRVTIDGFEPEPEDKIANTIDIVVREKCNLMGALPPMLHALIDRKDEIPKDWPVQTVATGGQPLTRKTSEALGPITQMLVSGYGGTEFGFLSIGASDEFKEYWCGTLWAGPEIEVKVVDENEQIVPINTEGELYIKSEGVFKCYHNDPLKTAAVKTPDGWYKTDDIGKITENGEIYIYRRKSNMIISGGMNVAPEILEDAIKQCPGIEAVIVVPIPDEVYYQVVCACLIREKGSDVTEEQVRTFCEDVHNDKPRMFTVLPKYYMFVESFPETRTGKTSRPALTELAKSVIEKS